MNQEVITATKSLAINLSVALACFSAVQLAKPTEARLLTSGTSSSSSFIPAQPVFSPEPQIPSHLLEDCFQSYCVARFKIKSNGTATVKLDTSSGSDEVDELALETLRRWKFKPATLDGDPVEGTKRIKVEFKVE